tara:strand:+ start:1331 stop:1783 length:453 start_codon:yes stop_codon:yes gene_type:complete
LRFLLLIITLCATSRCICQYNTIDELRSCFKTIESVREIEELISISNNHIDDPVVSAYNCTGKLMLLDYYGNPFEKYRIFINQTTQLDSIIKTNPKNIEIRLLRYTIQHNCPSFLLYNKDMSNDLKMIEMYLSQEDISLQDHINTILKSF